MHQPFVSGIVRRALLIAISCALMGIPASAGVIYVRHHAGPVFDGASWATAFTSVQSAVNAAAAGDEVWVAEGSYAENIILKSDVALYGGFAGTETSRSQRNWRTRVTVLDGRQSGSVVTVAKDAAGATRIDGFTITNGQAILGGGIYCGHRAIPLIVNNTITGNTAASEGGGIYCNLDSEPAIGNNRICGNIANAAGGGIRTTTGGTDIASNLLVGNSAVSGGGICCGDASTTSGENISNNTLVANTAVSGGAIYCLSNSSASISNNIIAFNASGIRKDSGTTVTLRSNCVYGNTLGDYSGVSQGATDILVDPMLASTKYGNLHIQPGSQCKEGGNNSYVVAGFSDIDGQPRVQGTVDIGADESDGTNWVVTPLIVRVAPGGSDSNDGSGWDSPHAKASIQAAVDAAASVGGEVWVRAGTYSGPVSLRDFVHVYGGFAGTETSVTQRNWQQNTTSINGHSAGSTVAARYLGHRISTLDGFRISSGLAQNGGGICCEGASPVIANNTITGNSADGKGGGIYLNLSSALVTGNTIVGNDSLTSGGGIYSDRSCADIFANSIDGNSASVSGCGIGFSSDNATRAVSNKIVRNEEETSLGDAWGGGVSVAPYGTPGITNNTILSNAASYYTIYCGPFGTLNVAGNVMCSNTGGIWADSSASVAGVRNNCLYGNTGSAYRGFTGGAGDIALDPLFVAPWKEDWRLRQNSPCIDAGYDSAVLAGWTDFEGNQRKMGLHVDIGCFEHNGVGHLVGSISEAKAFPEGVDMQLQGKPITAGFEGAFYVEETDRSSGLRILSAQTVNPGQFADVVGRMMLDTNGERSLSASSVTMVTGNPDDVPDALDLNHRWLGGSDFRYNEYGQSTGQQGILGAYGLNNIGLLVTVFGRVTERDSSPSPTWFRVDDGSQVADDSGQPGVKVLAAGLAIPDQGRFVRVTGISSCYKTGSDLYRLVRAVETAPLD